MAQKMKNCFLGIIPARGGSKGIKNKNIKAFNGKPLIYFTIQAARQSKLLDDVIVTTDSRKIAGIASRYKARVPFLRPASLAKDKTPSLPVLQHALLQYERMTKKFFSHIVVLQPTAPLRLSKDIDAAVKLAIKSPENDNIVSCYRNQNVHPKKMYVLQRGRARQYLKGHHGVFRRQDAEQIFIRNGSVYIIRRDLLMKNRVFGDNPAIMEMPRLRSIDIDTMEDWKLAETIMKGRLHL